MNYRYQALGNTNDGSGFPAHEGWLKSFEAAKAALANCWTRGDGWIAIYREEDAFAHVCFVGMKRSRVYLFHCANKNR